MKSNMVMTVFLFNKLAACTQKDKEVIRIYIYVCVCVCVCVCMCVYWGSKY